MPARIAPAVAPPPIDAMETAPGAFFDDFNLLGWRVPTQVFAIVGQPGQLLGFDLVQGISQGHVTETMMMPIALAVGCDMYQLRPTPLIRECADEPIRKMITARQ